MSSDDGTPTRLMQTIVRAPVLEALPVGSNGVDTIAKLTYDDAVRLRNAGMSFVIRYLHGLSLAEIDAITRAGLALGFVNYSRSPGWRPSPILGGADGIDYVRLARALAVPAGVTIWCDLEGRVSSPEEAILYCDAWADVVQSAGYVAGLYVGYADHPLSPQQLRELKVTRYWRSCSSVPDVADIGYCMTQERPPNQTVAGVLVDRDTVSADLLGRSPFFAA